MKLKQLILPLISVLFLLWPPKQISSCGFSMYAEEWRFWTFNPALKTEPGMFDLFYSADLYHQGFGDRYNYTEPEVSGPDMFQENITEWQNQLKKKFGVSNISNTDIENILYETPATEYFKLKEQGANHNSFLNFLYQHPDYLAYLDFAKQSEACSMEASEPWNTADCPKITGPGVVVPGDRWGYSELDEGSIDVSYDFNDSVITQAQQTIEEIKDPFLKTRYAYQLVRFGYYYYDSASVANYYLNYLQTLPDSWLKNSAFMYYVLNLPETEQNLGLAKIFENCPDKRTRCIQLYNNSNWEESEALANGNHEKAMQHVLRSLHDPSPCLSHISKIVSLDPNNAFLPALWVREVNKLEDWIMGTQYSEFGSTRNYIYQEEEAAVVANQLIADKKYAAELNQELRQYINTLKANPETSFYELCSGYIAFMCKDFEVAGNAYARVNQEKLNEQGKIQLSLCKLMLNLSQSKTITAQTEEATANAINMLQNLQKEYPQFRLIKSSLMNFLASEYIRRGSKAKGIMMFGQSFKAYASHPLIYVANVYTQIFELATTADIQEMIHILSEKNPGALNKILQQPVYPYTFESWDGTNTEPWDINKLRDIMSMKFVQQDKLAEAAAVLEKIEPGYWNNETYTLFANDNPFCVNPWNGHSPMNYQSRHYTKYTFLKELIQSKLAAQHAQGEEKAYLLMRIANAYYSMSYYGKYWIMQKNYQGGYEDEFQNPKDHVDPAYYNAARALYYYKQVFEYTQDPKLLAITAHMLNVAFRHMNDYTFAEPNEIKNNAQAKSYFDDLSQNCDLFSELIKTYNYFGDIKPTTHANHRPS